MFGEEIGQMSWTAHSLDVKRKQFDEISKFPFEFDKSCHESFEVIFTFIRTPESPMVQWLFHYEVISCWTRANFVLNKLNIVQICAGK